MIRDHRAGEALEGICDGCGAFIGPRAWLASASDLAERTRERAEATLRDRLDRHGWTVEDGTERVSCPACRERGGRG